LWSQGSLKELGFLDKLYTTVTVKVIEWDREPLVAVTVTL